MYIPEHFRLADERVDELLSSVRPGNLVTTHQDGPHATFLPFHLEHRGPGQRVLVTHLVRNNPQAREPVTGPAMVILDITDAYISPLWYATNDVQPNVPTWDYVTIHARGRLRVDPSPGAALAAARALTERMEGTDVLGPVGEEKLQAMSRAIVAAEVDVERLEGKAKMSQNRHPDDVRSLICHLEETGGPAAMVDFLREVSLPHAEERFRTLHRLRDARTVPAHRQGAAL